MKSTQKIVTTHTPPHFTTRSQFTTNSKPLAICFRRSSLFRSFGFSPQPLLWCTPIRPPLCFVYFCVLNAVSFSALSFSLSLAYSLCLARFCRSPPALCCRFCRFSFPRFGRFYSLSRFSFSVLFRSYPFFESSFLFH